MYAFIFTVPFKEVSKKYVYLLNINVLFIVMGQETRFILVLFLLFNERLGEF